MSVPTIGVMLTAYKRTHLLGKQIAAIRAQTVKPTKIFVWDNSGAAIAADCCILSATDNLGVWPRFMLSPLLGTDYIAVFDDDTIPGPRWFENCLATMDALQKDGHDSALLGSVGVSFVNGQRDQRTYWGWKHPADVAIEVDLVGHAWFFEPMLLDHFTRLETAADFPTCGEDYWLAFAAQKHGWPVVCPPHPEHDQSLWGSIDGMHNGSDSVALWRDPAEEEKKQRFHQFAAEQGMAFRALREGKNGFEMRAWGVDFDNRASVKAPVCPTCGRECEAG